jgi:hypothetical protein
MTGITGLGLVLSHSFVSYSAVSMLKFFIIF